MPLTAHYPTSPTTSADNLQLLPTHFTSRASPRIEPSPLPSPSTSTPPSNYHDSDEGGQYLAVPASESHFTHSSDDHEAIPLTLGNYGEFGPSAIKDTFGLPPDPSQWGLLTPGSEKDIEDDLYDHPIRHRDRFTVFLRNVFSHRGFANFGCILLLSIVIVGLFGGYPILSYFLRSHPTSNGGYGIGGVNASGQVPVMPGNFALIDNDTPENAMTKKSIADGSTWELVFSDEFNQDDRSFYPGDDPYWEAENLHYWGTNNLEWYDPSAITTKGGSLVITLDKIPTHDLDYQSGMLTSWNKFCFTGGYIEVSASLPGVSNVWGLWPAIWTMGNLGRAGYGASLDGTWPYSYDSCDVGTLPNQTLNGQPSAALTSGDTEKYGGSLSYLPGQRLSACTCSGEDHPGPKRGDGFVGRSAPEIDIFEALVDDNLKIGQVSQSAQWAPFNQAYLWQNTSGNFEIYDSSVTKANTYVGGVFQQSTSGISTTDPNCYSGAAGGYSLTTGTGGGCYSVYGFEYKPGNDGYITWVNNNKPAWTLMGSGLGPDSNTQIGQRIISQEPMYIIMNLGLSYNFGPIDLAELVFPTYLLVDYVRVYQPKGNINIGCNPKDFPTTDYINRHLDIYNNPNMTVWNNTGLPLPKNQLTGC